MEGPWIAFYGWNAYLNGDARCHLFGAGGSPRKVRFLTSLELHLASLEGVADGDNSAATLFGYKNSSVYGGLAAQTDFWRLYLHGHRFRCWTADDGKLVFDFTKGLPLRHKSPPGGHSG